MTSKNENFENHISKEKAILKIENDITNLAEIFNDLNIIVTNQSEFLNSIENNIITSNENVEQSVQILDTCNKTNQKKTKYILKILGGTIVLVPLVATPVFAQILGLKILVSTLISTTGIGSSLLIISNNKNNH